MRFARIASRWSGRGASLVLLLVLLAPAFALAARTNHPRPPARCR